MKEKRAGRTGSSADRPRGRELVPVPVRIEPDTRQQSRLAQREIILWTTKDGREIPLDEMSDDHIANAVRVLSLWRTRLKKRDRDNPVVRDLADAISRFKSIMRRRRKTIGKDEGETKKFGSRLKSKSPARQITARRR